ncbi:unnamed protein product [Calypogeia fissa]
MAVQLATIPVLISPVVRDVAQLNLYGASSKGIGIGTLISSTTSTGSFSALVAAQAAAGRNVHRNVHSSRTRAARRNLKDSSKCACCGTANGATVQDVKSALIGALEGVNRGIFGVSSLKKAEIDNLLTALEALNPSPRPTENLDMVKGEWRLLYSTISILGVKRTKLGLRDFVSLGEFLQIIDVEKNRAVNKIGFNVAGLGMLKGALTIEAAYHVTSPTRVAIQFETSSISPERLFSLFKKNYDLLLGIFNPEGWLEITYVDDTVRVGRDDKGNVFLLERA